MIVKWGRSGEATGPLDRIRRLVLRGRQPGPESRPSAEWLSRMEAVSSVAPSPLHDVVAIGQSADASGLVVELLALELRERGAILYWRAHSNREVVILGADVSVTDQFGTQYAVSLFAGGGDHRSWAGETIVLPRPPDGASLRVIIESFGPTPERPLPRHVDAQRIDGPWVFEVQLPGDIDKP